MRSFGGRALLALTLAFAPLMLTAAAPAAALPVIALAAPSVEGLRYESHSVFTLDPPARAVHVQVHLNVTNQSPPTSGGGYFRQIYFPRVGVPVLSEATNFSATRDDGASLTVTAEDTRSPHIKIAAIDLSPNLFYGQTQDIDFAYDLAAQPPRSLGTTRINDAFSSFLTFGYGDSGITSVQIKVPRSLESEVVGEDMKREEQGDQVVFTADALTNPDTWTAAVDARNDAQLVQKEATIDGQAISIKGWPDDPQWVEFVDRQVHDALPALQALIGQPWPSSASKLTVTETAAPYLYGYAGWFNPIEHSVEIGDALDPLVILHELSHTWFNRNLFPDRWVNEAFANEFASRALEKVGQPLESPQLVTADSPGAFKLNTWGRPKLQDSSTTAQEDFGYNASWFMLRSFSNEIGVEGLARVIDFSQRNLVAYRGSAEPERTTTTTDWKRLLDLLEEVGGSKQAVSLFQQFVVEDGDRPMLERRAQTRAAYQKFVDASGDWKAPLQIRTAMGRWDFDGAATLMSSARNVLATRDTIADTLRPLGLPFPSALRQHYESSEGDFSRVEEEAARALEAARHIVDADTAVHASHGPLGTIGMFFSHADDTLHSAERALDHGDAPAAIARADRAREMARDAAKTGAVGLFALFVVLATGVALAKWGVPYVQHLRLERAAARAAVTATAYWPPPPPALPPTLPPPTDTPQQPG